MLDVAHRALSQDKVRTLLRKLRDLNLSAGPIAVSRRARIALAGCLSTDAPAEGGVRYRVRLDDGSEGLLEIRGSATGLDIELTTKTTPRQLHAEVTCDRSGRACSRALAARVSPETCEARELEHFLRRIVRALFRAA
ncbi:MAG: hypothetical protein ACKVXR_04465 [Planctomycetota bacterium]